MITYIKDSNAPPQARGKPQCVNATLKLRGRKCMNEERQPEAVISNPFFSGEKSVTAEAGNYSFLSAPESYRDGMTSANRTATAGGGCKPVVTAFKPPGKTIGKMRVTVYRRGLCDYNPGSLVACFTGDGLLYF